MEAPLLRVGRCAPRTREAGSSVLRSARGWPPEALCVDAHACGFRRLPCSPPEQTCARPASLPTAARRARTAREVWAEAAKKMHILYKKGGRPHRTSIARGGGLFNATKLFTGFRCVEQRSVGAHAHGPAVA